MADNYYRHVITEKGLVFLAKQQTGETPNITRVIAGAGFVDESLLEQQIEVLEPVGQMQVGPRKVIDGKVVQLPVRLVNTDLEEDETALIRQIGVYSKDPDEGEILYQLLQYSVPQPLPSVAAIRGAPAALRVDIDVTFSNSEEAQINPTPSWGVTLDELDVANIKQNIMAGEDGKPVNLEYLLRSYNENGLKLEADIKTLFDEKAGLSTPDATNWDSGNIALSKGANGYLKLPNGFVRQWGVTSSLTAGGKLTITFPLAFSAKYVVTATPDSSTATANVTVSYASTTSFMITSNEAIGAAYWEAIGVI